ncbi:MAG: hypothetical protein SWH61_02990 [Thermodesulfobacteriota bacterium]|nr:hypothetical protein [Thermodesulfobacteriota bacterium]
MIKKTITSLFCIYIFSGLSVSPAHALEIQTRYATIIYPSQKLLEKMNYKIYLGKLRYYMPKNLTTIEAEFGAKIDVIIEQVQSVLDMTPENLRFRVTILPDVAAVRDSYVAIYGQSVSYVAFYSPSQNTVYMSPDKANLKVIAHELGHVVVENYFQIPPPVKVHEILAQFAERHLIN